MSARCRISVWLRGVGRTSSVEIVGTKGTARVTVTGLGFVPELSHNTYAEGGWLTPGAYDTLFDGFTEDIGLVALCLD